MSEQSKERVTIPELKALIAQINRSFPDTKKLLSLPDVKMRQVVILEFKADPIARSQEVDMNYGHPLVGWLYKTTHSFDYPRKAKEFLVKRLNNLMTGEIMPGNAAFSRVVGTE